MTPETAAIGLLRRVLEAEDYMVADSDEDSLSIYVEIMDYFDHLKEEWVGHHDPPVIGVHFCCYQAEQDDWTVTLETPVISRLGKLGELLEALLEDENGWRLSSEEGAAAIEYTRTLRMSAEQGEEVLLQTYELYLQILADFGPTGLSFAGMEEEQNGVKTPGFLEIKLGEAAANDRRFEDALEYFERARQIFSDGDMPFYELTARSLWATALFMNKGPAEATAVLEACATEAQSLEDESELAATVLGMVGACRAFANDLTGAHKAFEQALSLGDIGDMESLVNMIRMRLPGFASDLVAAMQKPEYFESIADDPGKVAEARVLMSLHHRRVGAFDEALKDLERAEKALRSHDDFGLQLGVLGELCFMLIVNRDLERARTVFEQVKRTPDHWTVPLPHRQQMLDTLGMMLGDIAAGASTVQHPEPLAGSVSADLHRLMEVSATADDFDSRIAALEHACRFARDSGDEMAIAFSLSELARHRMNMVVRERRLDLRSQTKQAQREIIEAIAVHDRCRHKFSSAPDRSRYMAEILGTYELGMLIACDVTDDRSLVAEMLARLQVLGLPDRSTDTNSELLPVVEPVHVIVGGASRLASPGSRTVDLEEQIVGQAGAGSWWWSMWSGAQFVFWATRSPDGRIEAGTVPLDPTNLKKAIEEHVNGPFGPVMKRQIGTGQLGDLLAELRGGLPVGGTKTSESAADPLDGPLGRDHENEERLMSAIGDLLIPAGLKQALSKAERSRPVRILYDPSPALSWLPLNLLGIGTDEQNRSVRLLERAVLTGSAPFLDGLGTNQNKEVQGILAVVDPQDDLVAMRPLATRAAKVLAGPSVRRMLELDDEAVADKAGVLAALSSAHRYRTFLYAGHARKGAERLSGGLAVGFGPDQTILSTEELVAKAADLRLPPNIILCACSTAADVSPPGTEQWGLAAAMFLGGGERVVATTWDVLSCATTASFIGRLALTFEHDEPALALRRRQLEMLDAWRHDVSTDNTGFDQTSSACHHPYLWAPFVMMGCTGP